MVDLHMHSVYSDGSKTVEEILKMCEEKKLEKQDDKRYRTQKTISGKKISVVQIKPNEDGYIPKKDPFNNGFNPPFGMKF